MIHFDLAGDAKDYQHRSGRTARAGATGTVVTMVMRGQERDVSKIQRELGMETVIGRPAVEELTEARPKQRVKDNVGSPTENRRPQPHKGTVSLYVGNLPWTTRPQELESLFTKYGTVGSVTLINDRRGRSKGYGFVEMAGDSAETIIVNARGASLGGRKLQVRPAT